MKFDDLNKMIPYAVGGKEKSLTMSPYPFITLAMPGRHAKDTNPVGGDFCVMISSRDTVFDRPDWTNHQFTHTDIFQDLERKTNFHNVGDWNAGKQFLRAYLDVIKGTDPDKIGLELSAPGVHPMDMLHAVQCLAVAEHRRYAQHEAKFGGRFLPFRFGAGIVEGLWSATDAADKQKRGRPGVEWLEKDFGTPVLTKELMND